MDVTLDNIKIGMKLRVKHYDKRPNTWNPDGLMDKYMGKIVTVKSITPKESIRILEDQTDRRNGGGWVWSACNFEYVDCIFTNPVNKCNRQLLI